MEASFQQIAGIDFGSKLAGTTVIAFAGDGDGQVCLTQSRKKADADRFISEWVEQYRPAAIFLDAPLSLPGVYGGLAGYDDFFYRRADRQLKAMSPMFLGGLTARAMRLKRQFQEAGITVQEVYPAAMAQLLGLPELGYKKNNEAIPDIVSRIKARFPVGIKPEPAGSWHEVDALLALLSGWRFSGNRHRCYGDPAEGLIIV